MLIGSDTGTLVSQSSSGATDRLGIKAPVSTSFSLTGSLQPISVNDKLSDTAYADSTNKFYTYPTDAALNAQAEDKFIFDGVHYRVKGVQIYRNRRGENHHVRLILKWEKASADG